MILLDRVSKTYGKGSSALNRISLHVQDGEFVIVVGTSGAGKSTLMKLITRELKPSSGRMVIGNIDYDTLKDREIPLLRRKIGVVFQDFKLLENRTVHENVAFALEIAGSTNAEIAHTVPRVLDLVGLHDKAKKFPSQLSGGERQRVAIARAVVRQPKILIADEPTGNLDPQHAWDIIEILQKINAYGTTVMLTTHNMEIVEKLGRRVITVQDGKVVKDQAQSGSGSAAARAEEAEAHARPALKPSKRAGAKSLASKLTKSASSAGKGAAGKAGRAGKAASSKAGSKAASGVKRTGKAASKRRRS